MILRPTTGPEDWRTFLAKPELHWKRGRSAMETAHSWESANGLPTAIVTIFKEAELLFAIPEFKVSLPGGDRDSQNDVFALLRDDDGLITCMVEAKRDEPFGPTLAQWDAESSAGKTERLNAICALLGLNPRNLSPYLRYQLFHRTASAVLTAARFHTNRAAMVIQSFSPEHRWFGDFSAFTALFNLEPKRNEPASTTLPNGCVLTIGWVNSPIRTEEITP